MKNITYNIKNKKWLLFLLYGIIATLCVIKLFYCSVSLNGNVFHCMTADYWNFGKCILGGQQLYVDLLDHKGIYLYWIYALLHIVSKGNVGVVAVIETLLFSITVVSFTWFINNTTKNFLKSVVLGIVYSIFYFIITLNATLLNVEGLLTPFYFWIYYVAIFKENKNTKDFFFIGILLGFFITIKYSSVLYFCYLFAYFTIFYFIRKNEPIQYIKIIIYGIAGLFVSIFPFVFYLIETNTWDVYWNLMSQSSNIDIAQLMLYFASSFVLFAIAIVSYLKNNKPNNLYISLSIFTFASIGAYLINNYSCLMFSILMVGICFLKKMNLSSVIYAGIMMVYFCLIFPNIVDTNFDINKISNKYEIDNSNVLYFTEDLGYGANKKELFQEPYQWLPARMLKNPIFYREIHDIYKDRILKKQFTYIVGYCNLEVDNDNEYYKMWSSLKPIVEENYIEIKDDYLFEETSLLMAK